MVLKNISKPLENIILYLNSETNCVKNTSGSRNYEFTWQISPIILSEYSICKVISVAHDAVTHSTDHADNIITFRLKDIIYNPENYRSTDNSGYPIIHSMPFDSESQYYNADLGGLYLVPQTINRISIIPTDSTTNANNGVNSNIQFIIGLVFQQYDRKFSDIEN
jgi:hypothetical protein